MSRNRFNASTGRGGPRAPSQRQLRVGEELRHALAEVLQKRGFRDPDLASVILTVTEIRPSPDLRNATVFVAPLGGGDTKAIMKALGRAAPYLRSEVARMVHLKYLPQFSFKLDESFDEAARIGTALRAPEVARDISEPDPDPLSEDDPDSEPTG